MIRRRVNRSDLEKEPHLSWNAFIDLIAGEDYEDLTDVQKAAHLIFWYDAEVNNGGHLQYFLNSAGRRASEAADALSTLKLSCQEAILADAIAYRLCNPLREINTPEEFVEEALGGRFKEFDSRYSDCPVQTLDFLEDYLEQNFNEFIELT